MGVGTDYVRKRVGTKIHTFGVSPGGHKSQWSFT